MLMIIGGVLTALGLISIILSAPRLFREALRDGVPPSHFVSSAIGSALVWTFCYFVFGFNLPITLVCLAVPSFIWFFARRYKRH